MKISEAFTDGGALKTLAVLDAIPKRAAKFMEEKKHREAAASRDDLTEWISKLSSQKRSNEEEIKSRIEERDTAQKKIKDFEVLIASLKSELHRSIEAADADTDRHFDLLNKMNRLTNDRKAETDRVERLAVQVEALKKQVGDIDGELKTLQSKLDNLKA